MQSSSKQAAGQSQRQQIKARMASGGEQVSFRTEKLETASAEPLSAESKIYKEEEVAGKGVGCIARKEIKKGSLVLREAPQLLHPDYNPGITHFEQFCEQIEVIVNSFMMMSKKDQESYLDLHSMFDDDKARWSNGMKQHFTALQDSMNQMTFPISTEKAFKVMAIKATN